MICQISFVINVKRRKMIIAIDFDGTCVKHKYPNIGDDIGAVPVLKKFVENGHRLVLNTMRSGKELDDAVQWFNNNGIVLYGINQTPGQDTWTQSPKVYAHKYIDDNALGCPRTKDEDGNIYVDWNVVAQMFGYE